METTVLVDDIDKKSTKGVVRHTVTVDDESWEIDLTPANWEAIKGEFGYHLGAYGRVIEHRQFPFTADEGVAATAKELTDQAWANAEEVNAEISRETGLSVPEVDTIVQNAKDDVAARRKHKAPKAPFKLEKPARKMTRAQFEKQAQVKRKAGDPAVTVSTVRLWASSQPGIEIALRGRIPNDVVTAFNKAHPQNKFIQV